MATMTMEMVATDDDNLNLIEGEPEHLPRNNRPLSEGGSPEVSGITATDLHQFVAFFSFSMFLIFWLSEIFLSFLTFLTFWLS